jgi:hypothetical protein
MINQEIKNRKCKRHGIITPDIGYHEKQKNGVIRLRCKICRNESWMIQAANGKEKICYKHGALKIEEIASRGRCKICIREYSSTRDLEKKRYYERIRYHKDIEKSREKRNLYRKKNLEAHRINSTTYNKNITRDQYHEMLKTQENKCAICKNPETRRNVRGTEITRLCIDHCHKTGKVRQLLCHSCNTGIGKFKDSVALLQEAIEYLRKHNSHDEIAS